MGGATARGGNYRGRGAGSIASRADPALTPGVARGAEGGGAGCAELRRRSRLPRRCRTGHRARARSATASRDRILPTALPRGSPRCRHGVHELRRSDRVFRSFARTKPGADENRVVSRHALAARALRSGEPLGALLNARAARRSRRRRRGRRRSASRTRRIRRCPIRPGCCPRDGRRRRRRCRHAH